MPGLPSARANYISQPFLSSQHSSSFISKVPDKPASPSTSSSLLRLRFWVTPDGDVLAQTPPHTHTRVDGIIWEKAALHLQQMIYSQRKGSLGFDILCSDIWLWILPSKWSEVLHFVWADVIQWHRERFVLQCLFIRLPAVIVYAKPQTAALAEFLFFT